MTRANPGDKMRNSRSSKTRTLFRVLKAFCLLALPATLHATRAVGDLSSVRGFNYTPATAAGHGGFWQDYDPQTVDHDLNLAIRLNLNQARVFVPYDAWAANKTAAQAHLIDFVRACNKYHIGVMPVLAVGDRMID
jgi:hypothetical protein